MNLFQRTAKMFNKVVTPMLSLPVIGPLLGKQMVTVSYVGKKSGTNFSLPVQYQRSGDTVQIGVMMPEKKQWWRNFRGDGAPLTIHFPDGDRTGHAVARTGPKGTSVSVTLD